MTEPESGQPYHISVLRDEVVALLDPKPGGVAVDCTIGAGGHARAIAERLRPGGRLIGLDRDPEAIAEAGRNLADLGNAVTLVRARFDSLPQILDAHSIPEVDAILYDLGVSSRQFDAAYRGFGFKDPDAPLDARMDQTAPGPTAADLINTLSEAELTRLIRDNSDERWAARIARFIVERRKTEPYARAGQLVDTVLAAIPAAARPPDKNAATRTFQAFRIAVNDELTILGHALEAAAGRLRRGGVLAVISFHSLEDRIVKELFNRLSGRGPGEGPYGQRPPSTAMLLTKKPVTASDAEVARNPRARSACLRAIKRI